MDEGSQPSIPQWRSVIHTGTQAEVRVRQLGIPGAALIAQALHAGASGARAAMGRYHAAAYAGDRMWGESHAEFGRLLDPHGWESDRIFGVDLVLHRVHGMAVIVTAGDSAAGHPTMPSPKVRYPRKKAIQMLVNGEADSLFGHAPRPVWSVWFLLHHVSATSLSAELSRPAKIAGDGSVNGWIERVMIACDDYRGPGGRVADNEGDSPVGDPPIEINVRRRAN
jgi:hypothetical protein